MGEALPEAVKEIVAESIHQKVLEWWGRGTAFEACAWFCLRWTWFRLSCPDNPVIVSMFTIERPQDVDRMIYWCSKMYGEEKQLFFSDLRWRSSLFLASTANLRPETQRWICLLVKPTKRDQQPFYPSIKGAAFLKLRLSRCQVYCSICLSNFELRSSFL